MKILNGKYFLKIQIINLLYFKKFYKKIFLMEALLSYVVFLVIHSLTKL